MFGTNRSGVNAYAKIGLETGVVGATPLRMVVMLYEGAITACIHARKAIISNDINTKSDSISKAISIIQSGLRASLDIEAGGQLAENLDALYEYMTSGLMHASFKMDAQKVEEIQSLLMELKSAWATLEKRQASEIKDMPAPLMPPASEAGIGGNQRYISATGM